MTTIGYTRSLHLRGSVEDEQASYVSDDSGEIVATMHGSNHRDNALLFVSAPQLVHELRALLFKYGQGDGSKRGTLLDRESELRIARILTQALGS